MDFSFGIAIENGFQRHSLANSDFASTDLAIEMFYLTAAKNAEIDSSHTFNQCLQGAKVVAKEPAFTDTLTGRKNFCALNLSLGRSSEAKVSYRDAAWP